MPETKIYMEFDEKLQEVMADNQLTISDILRQDSIKAKVTNGMTPYEDEEGARPKELVTIILEQCFDRFYQFCHFKGTE